MVRQTLLLRDHRNREHAIEVGQDGSVSTGGRVIDVRRVHPGELRVGERLVWAASDGDIRWVFVDGQVYTFVLQRPGARVPRHARHEGSLSAPMPATVVKIMVSPGDEVRAGDVLIILEAMKMELPVRADADGVVASVACREGELVPPGQDLIVMTATSTLPRPDVAIPAPKGAAEEQ